MARHVQSILALVVGIVIGSLSNVIFRDGVADIVRDGDTSGITGCTGIAALPASHPSASISTEEQREIQRTLGAMNFKNVYHFVSMWTMVNKAKLQMVHDAVIILNAKGIPGDIVECGVWKGGATMTMMLAALSNGDMSNPRTFWLFDTFQGLPKPTQEDGDKAQKIWSEVNAGQNLSARDGMLDIASNGKWNYGPKPIVKNNIRSTGYPTTHIRLVEGKVEDTLPITKLPAKFAVVRLDTDWYLSTKMELEMMWDRLSSGGLLIIDDYCSWGGSTKATDEFFQSRGLSSILAKAKTKLSKRPAAVRKFECIHIWKP